MVNEEYPHSAITEKIIGSAFRVHNRLGEGFQEKVYENALAEELKVQGMMVEQQKDLSVVYGGKPVGDFTVDLLVDKCIVVELKAKKELERSHERQLINYLKVSGLEVGLLINFGESVSVRRKVNSFGKGESV